ncbi:MAG: Tol-Pal system protein TolB, partial [Methylobacterium sp.]
MPTTTESIMHRSLLESPVSKGLTSLLALLALVLFGLSPAAAQLNLRIGGGSFQPMPIAVTDFTGDPSLGLLVSSVVTNNLRRSGYFTPVEKAKFPEAPAFDAVPGFEKWRAAGVQALITGRVARDAAGKLKVEFRLWDVTSGQQMTGQQYGTDPANARRTGHLISDAVYTKITGLGPWFDSRIAFVDESGSKEHRRKRLMVMDQDGANVRALTNGENAVVAPRYSPATQDIA